MLEGTLDEVYRPLMRADSIIASHCVVCGRSNPLNQHHIVWRSWGELSADGHRLKKPTVTLCGFGNHLKDSDGRYYCHGLAHHRMLHFRVHRDTVDSFSTGTRFPGSVDVDRLQYIITDEPTDYLTALDMEGWRSL